MSQMNPPVIVIDGHDFAFYESAEAVGQHLETWYLDEPYLAFDSDGRRLELVIEEQVFARRWLPDRTVERVGVRTLEDEPSDPGVLAGLLREHLDRAGITMPAAASLPESFIARSARRVTASGIVQAG
jgi:hypothetical protein